MIWIWVGILIVFLAMNSFLKNMILTLLAASTLLAIVVDLASSLEYYYEILIFFMVNMFLISGYFILKNKYYIK